MNFEFDPAKSASNKEKHGIDFVEAQALWKGRTVEAAAKTDRGEMRYGVFGEIKAVVYVAIISYRGTVRRIISVRKATEPEAAYYASKKPKP